MLQLVVDAQMDHTVSLQGVIKQATANLTGLRFFSTFKIQVMESTEQLVRPLKLPINLTEKNIDPASVFRVGSIFITSTNFKPNITQPAFIQLLLRLYSWK